MVRCGGRGGAWGNTGPAAWRRQRRGVGWLPQPWRARGPTPLQLASQVCACSAWCSERMCHRGRCTCLWRRPAVPGRPTTTPDPRELASHTATIACLRRGNSQPCACTMLCAVQVAKAPMKPHTPQLAHLLAPEADAGPAPHTIALLPTRISGLPARTPVRPARPPHSRTPTCVSSTTQASGVTPSDPPRNMPPRPPLPTVPAPAAASPATARSASCRRMSPTTSRTQAS